MGVEHPAIRHDSKDTVASSKSQPLTRWGVPGNELSQEADNLQPLMTQPRHRAVSKGLFGNRHKLEVLGAIAETIAGGEQDVYPRMISKMLSDAADNQAGEVFNQLHKSGLLNPVTDKTDLQRHRYRARESDLWEMVRALVDELRAASWDHAVV